MKKKNTLYYAVWGRNLNMRPILGGSFEKILLFLYKFIPLNTFQCVLGSDGMQRNNHVLRFCSIERQNNKVMDSSTHPRNTRSPASEKIYISENH